MKVAVSSSGRDLDAQIDPRFGRCAYFIIVETDDMSFEVFDNENIALGGGAGIQSGQFVASKGAKTIITGNAGPNAVRTLSAAGVEVIVGQEGTVRKAIEDFKKRKLKSTTEANVADHYGMGNNPAQDTSVGAPPRQGGLGTGGGMGMGRCGGMGRGRGMGMGRGRGMGAGMPASGSVSSNQPEPAPLSKGEALKSLKDQANDLRKQIENIESSIKDLEKK
ncbi:MAG: NifB/NifX family molybdenum-iron cluster-binding protein [Pseudomonadota bacterium]